MSNGSIWVKFAVLGFSNILRKRSIFEISKRVVKTTFHDYGFDADSCGEIHFQSEKNANLETTQRKRRYRNWDGICQETIPYVLCQQIREYVFPSRRCAMDVLTKSLRYFTAVSTRFAKNNIHRFKLH